MAQQQVNIQISAPGFNGLNTQDSPVGMSLEYASVADNVIIDDYGRIGTRKGLVQYTANTAGSIVGNPAIRTFEFVDKAGVSWVFVCANGKIYTQGQTAPFELTQLPYINSTVVGATQNYWQMVGLSDRAYFIQAGLPILVFNAATQGATPGVSEGLPHDLTVFLAANGYPNCATTAFGRLFVADCDNYKNAIFYTTVTTGGALTWAGAIEVSEFWPAGTDTVVAIKAHNNFLIVFGKRSILVYSIGPDFENDLLLVDTIEGMGCIARDSIVATGKDLLFLDSTGVRAFSRTIQEKSMPIGDVSYNVKNDIQTLIAVEPTKNIVGVFSPEESLYAILFPNQNITYLLNTKVYLENGSFKVTRIPSKTIHCGLRTTSRTLFFGGVGGLHKYDGADDVVTNGTSLAGPSVGTHCIFFRYWTQPQTFGSPERLKLLKQLDMTAIGGTTYQMFVKWAYDYGASSTNETFFEGEGTVPAYYNTTAEYNIAEYSGGGGSILTGSVNIWGSGRVVKFGFEANICDTSFSIQELNIQALLGRII